MPYNPTNPPTEPVYAPATKPIDTYYFTTVRIDLQPANPAETVIHVEWNEGFMDGGNFVASTRKVADLSGPTLLAAMNQPVTPGSTHYDDFRNALWDYMEAEGLIPPGSVT